MKSIFKGHGLLAFILVVLLPAERAEPRSERRRAAGGGFVCGTSAEREIDVLARGRYHESRMRAERERGRARVLLGPDQKAQVTDVGDVAVIEDDGTIVTEPNAFDLEQKSFRFEPAGGISYRVAATSTVFDAAGGIPVTLTDDDTAAIDIGFAFPFYGQNYTRVQLNSDGNLTFNQPDTSSTARDLGRFFSGPPRIGPFFSDLDPPRGTVVVRRDADSTLFAWNAVPEFSEGGSSRFNSFSARLFRNGHIEFVYGATVDTLESVVGISPGGSQGTINAVDFAGVPPANVLAGTIVEVFTADFQVSDVGLAKKFLATHPDAFDHLTVFLGFDYDLGGGAFAYEINVKNEIRGIGLGVTDNSAEFGSSGRLRSFLNMGTLTGIGRYPSDPQRTFLGTNSTIGIMGQESGHRWLAFTPYRDQSGRNSKTILGRDDAHWSFFFDSDGSVMEGNDIEDRGEAQGNQRFVTVRATNTFSRLDQYIMGLRGKDEVPGMFLVENPVGTTKSASGAPQLNVQFGGVRQEITIDQIIAANGLREPSFLQAPKVFRQGFILLTRRGQPATAEQIEKVQRIRDAWVQFFNAETQGLGWVVTSLQDTPGTTPRTIVYPYFQGNTSRYTGIAVANWGATPADVLFRAFDNTGRPMETPGNIINPRMLTIAPGAQIALLGEELHGLSLQDPRNGWIRAESTSSQVSGFFLDGDVDQNLLDGTVACGGTSSRLFFTRGPGAVGYRNVINVVNPNGSAVQLLFSLRNSSGAAVAAAERTLAANGRLAEEIGALFPGQSLAGGYVSLTAGAGVVGYQYLDGGRTVFSLPAQPASSAARLYSAEFASGRAGAIQYFTDVNLVNTGDTSRSVEVLLVGNNGTPVGGIANPFRTQLAPGAQLHRTGEDLFGLPDAGSSAQIVEGSLVVTSDGPGVIGDVTFGDPLNERFVASLPLDGAPAAEMVLSHVAQGRAGGTKPYFTGVAIYNPNAAAVQVTMDVHSQNGATTGSAQIPLAAGGRISKTLPELIPGITEQIRGYIRLRSSGGPIVAFELFGDQTPDFLSAVPPQPLN